MKKPYIKKVGKASGFIVWIVDGEYIRNNVDEEFTNFGHHYSFSFIPEKEFWIDKEHSGDETRYYIDHMLVENRLMAEGKDYDEASGRADLVEGRERHKSKLIEKELKSKAAQSTILKKIHKKLLKKYSNNIKVWIVNGELVRDLFFVEFTEGGHDKVYPFIPKGEIWIDDDVVQEEMKFILLHELHERNLIERGWPYDPEDKRPIIALANKSDLHKSAHVAASEIEYFYRRHPEKIDKILLQEVKKSR